MHDYFMLEMEENINGVPPFNDWEGLAVEEFETKPIIETLEFDAAEFERINIIDGVSMNGLMNHAFSDNDQSVVAMEFESKKSSSSSSSPPDGDHYHHHEVNEYKKRSIAERRAAKFGFDASRINVAKFKAHVSPPTSPPVRSPYLTIPPGLSPAALLDSPVMLPNYQGRLQQASLTGVHTGKTTSNAGFITRNEAQPSPTTGTLQFPQSNNDGFLLVLNSTSPAVDGDKDSVTHVSALSTERMPCKPSAEDKILTASKSPMESVKEDDSLKSSAVDTFGEAKISRKMSTSNASHNNVQKNSTNTIKVQLPPLRDIKAETGVSQGSMPEEHKGAYSPAAAAADLLQNAEDGYSWRKYGQKHVKGSEYPRSYYKCNHSSCPVKKKVERSHDGEITEIIYKGAHNHPKPHPRINLAGALTTSGEMMETSDQGNEPANCLKVESGTGWKYNDNQLIKGRDASRVGNSDWRPPDGLERTSSTSVLTDMLDPLMAAVQGNKSASLLGSAVDTTELTSSRIASLDYGEDEDGTTQGSTSQGDEADADESEAKRRKKETYSTEAYLPSRSNREPRVIVQIESEIDVLDDGYRWRKYGQKVVKGNPNPRSYYKCTSAGCPVRKHVERASDDIKSVLTTYEGKHNHEVPTTKTGTGLPNSTFSSPPDHVASNPHTALISVSRNPKVPNREMKVQDLPPLHYEMKPALGSDFLRSNLLGDFKSDIQIGPSSMYPLKFPPTPPLPGNMPYGSYMMNSTGAESCQKFPPLMLDFPMSIPLNVPRPSPNMALNNNFHPYNNHNHAMQNSTLLRSSIGDQQIKESTGDPRFRRPKEEKRDDCSISETCL